MHVIDRDELCRTRADDPGSWLAEAQGIARLCGVDDAVARLAGSSLRRLLWFGREHLDTECVGTALADLGRATESLAAARGSYHAAVERMAFASERWACGTQAQLEVVDQLAQEDVHSINLEVRALAEVQAEWEGHTSSAGR